MAKRIFTIVSVIFLSGVAGFAFARVVIFLTEKAG
jgi:hypothetical protein